MEKKQEDIGRRKSQLESSQYTDFKKKKNPISESND